MLAAVGAELHPDVPAAAAAMAGDRHEPVLPDPQRAATYHAAYERYRKLYGAVRPLF
jgi:ribulose kinase